MIWKVSGIIAVIIGIIFFEFPYLLKTGSKKDLAAFFVFLAGGVAYAILYVLGVKLTSPYGWMAEIDKPITDFIMKILE